MLYPSGMLVARPAADGTGALSYTKHYFAGTQRVSSKIGTTTNLGKFLQPWTLLENSSGGAPINLVSTSHDQLTVAETGVTHVYTQFAITPTPTFSSNTAFLPVSSFTGTATETEHYFFHPDHLGSSNYITNFVGEVSQHMEYFAFGETFIEEHKNSHNSPYKFNGKELDEESGLYYYGARYYDPRISIWASIDPLAEKFPDMSPYNYCGNNPISNIDPDGRDIIPVHGTWSNNKTWQDLKGITNASKNLFGDNRLGNSYGWSGGNYAQLRTEAALGLIDHVRAQMKSESFNGEITLVGHSHGGNVSIEALNLMAEMKEFDNVQLNLLTINTPVREDYQLSKKATGRVNHVNVYDEEDPVQSKGGKSLIILPDDPSNKKGTGEFGSAGRTFKNAKNIKVDNPQGLIEGHIMGFYIGDYHNSHNRVKDWIKKTE